MITEKLIVVAHKDVLVRTEDACIRFVEVKVCGKHLIFHPGDIITVIPHDDMTNYRDLSQPHAVKTIKRSAAQVYFGRADEWQAQGIEVL